MLLENCLKSVKYLQLPKMSKYEQITIKNFDILNKTNLILQNNYANVTQKYVYDAG